jgi:membrane protein
MVKKAWNSTYELVRDTILEFIDDHAIYYSASLAYFTIFALPSLLIVIIAAAGSLMGKETISLEIYQQIGELAGHDSAAQVQQMVEQANTSKSSFFAKVIALITLVIAATGVFTAIQNALNLMWDVKPKPKLNILKLIQDRVLSFALIIGIAFLLLVSLVIHAGLVAIIKFINIEPATVALIQTSNFLIPLTVTIILFAIIFKFLPDAKVKWRDVTAGAVVTGLLFTGGKFLVGLYLGQSDLGSAYGAAGTIIILLLWVYFSSILLFFGAEFTQVYARKYGRSIEPSTYAVRIQRKIVDPSDK